MTDVHGDDVAPPGIDVSTPSVARVYDYVLGGRDNFAADRAAAAAFMDRVPEAVEMAQENRAALRRVVRWLVERAGVRHILDIGSGLPTAGNVHEVARELDPGVNVVYVDIDPIVLAHARALLAADDRTTVIPGDIREPASIFADPAVGRLIDLTQPYAILASGVLHHFADDEDPAAMAHALVDRLPSGGYLYVSNFLDGGDPRARTLEDGFLRGGLGRGRFRTREEQLPFYEGLELVDPGFVPLNDWHPDLQTPRDSRTRELMGGAVGRKP